MSCRHVASCISLVTLLLLLPFTDTVSEGSPKKPGGGGSNSNNSLYTAVVLPDASGAVRDGSANGMNEVRNSAGQLIGLEVVGALYGPSPAYYWLLDASGTLLSAQPLSHPIGADPASLHMSAQDINDEGVIVGFGVSYPVWRPHIWSSAANMPQELPVPDFADSGLAYNINNSGLVIGELRSGNLRFLAAWGVKSNGSFVGPVVLSGDLVGDDPDVNDRGLVVANTSSAACAWQVEWDGDTLSSTDPVVLPIWSATGVNEHGDICGQYIRDGVRQGCLLTAEGQVIDVAELVNNRRYATAESAVLDLNDAANANSIQIVGQGSIYEKRTGAVVEWPIALAWSGNDATELQNVTSQSTAQLALQKLFVVSDAGWMVGYGWNEDSSPRPVAIVPTEQ